MSFEYKVVPAPTKGQKAKGVKSAEERFAYAIERVMNDLASDGWEYLRTDTLPSTERAGLTGTTTEWRNLLVFRRSAVTEAEVSEISHLRDDVAESSMAPRPVPGPGHIEMVTEHKPDNLTRLPGVKKPTISAD